MHEKLALLSKLPTDGCSVESYFNVHHLPYRYRSQLCNDGPKCRRKVCFFAHTIDELRVPPSKPFVAPDMLVGSPETEAAEPQVHA